MFKNSTSVCFVSIDTNGTQWVLAILLHWYLQTSENVSLHKPFSWVQTFFLDKTSLSCTVCSQLLHISPGCACTTAGVAVQRIGSTNWFWIILELSGWDGKKWKARIGDLGKKVPVELQAETLTLFVSRGWEVTVVQAVWYTINGFYRPWKLKRRCCFVNTEIQPCFCFFFF